MANSRRTSILLGFTLLPILLGFLLLMVGAYGVPVAQAQGEEEVVIAVEPAVITVTEGTTFSVTVEVRAGNQQVDGAEAHLDFDPAVLEVVELTPGDSLETVIQRQFSNVTGTIDFAAGTFADFPSGTFDLVHIQFQAVAAAPASTTLEFQREPPRQTNVTFRGESVLDAVIDGRVVVQGPTAITLASLTSVETGSGSIKPWLSALLGATLLLATGTALYRRVR